VRRVHWPFEDPAAATGTREERLAAFRRVRDLMRARFEAFVESPERATRG
jgi:arsenate reductase